MLHTHSAVTVCIKCFNFQISTKCPFRIDKLPKCVHTWFNCTAIIRGGQFWEEFIKCTSMNYKCFCQWELKMRLCFNIQWIISTCKVNITMLYQDSIYIFRYIYISELEWAYVVIYCTVHQTMKCVITLFWHWIYIYYTSVSNQV